MKNNTVILIFGGVIVALLVLDSAMSQVCPQCKCPTTFKPVCAYSSTTRTYRGYQSRCVLNCYNACNRNKYTYRGEGKCSIYKDKVTTTTTTKTPPLPYRNNTVA